MLTRVSEVFRYIFRYGGSGDYWGIPVFQNDWASLLV
jgi:hypothetical protein